MLAQELEKLRLATDSDPFDDFVVRSIESFVPYRNEAIEVFIALARNANADRSIPHRFFEALIPYLDRPQRVSGYREWDWDNFRFIIHELFLYAVATLARYEQFESVRHLMSTKYYSQYRADNGTEPMVSFDTFRRHVESLQFRNKRLNLNRLSTHADLLLERCQGIGIEFRHLMQADFILFLYSSIAKSGSRTWWPETLLYSDRQPGPFEIFARSRSAKYFARAKILLGVDTREELKAALDVLVNRSSLPTWQYHSFSPHYLVGLDALATEP